jgi:hypothetical protein
MEHNREETKKNSGGQQRGNGGHGEQASGREKVFENGKKARILQCLGNLNALHKVQGALLGQIEREIE